MCETEYDALAAECPDRGTLAHLRLLRARVLYRVRQRQEAMRELSVADHLYSQMDDMAGLAEIQLTLGDWEVAPLSSPEVWNSFLAEGTYDTSLHWQIDKAEADVDVECVDEAKARYETALDLFKCVDVRRGVAATSLRLGYLSVLKGMRHIDFEEDYVAAKDEIESSMRLSNELGDVFAFRLGQAQLALCVVGQGEVPERQETAISIGQWGCTEGSFGFALGIGLFFGRMGWRWVNQIGDYERALACFRLAQALFKSLHAPLSHIHSIIDQLKVYKFIGDFPSCSRMSEQALDEYLDIRRRKPNLAQDVAQLARWLSLQMLGLANRRAAPRIIESVWRYIQSTRDTQRPSHQASQSSTLDALLSRLFAQLQTSQDNGVAASSEYLQITEVFLESQLADSELYQHLYRGKDALKSGLTDMAHSHFDHVRRAASTFSGSRLHYFKALAFAYEGQYSEAAVEYRHCVEEELGAVDRKAGPSSSTPLDNDRRRQIADRALSFFCEIGEFGEGQKWLKFLSHWPDWCRKEGQEWLSLRRIGQVEEGMGELNSALLKYEEAIHAFESQRQRLSIDELKVAFSGDSSTRALYFDCTRTALELRDRPETSAERAKELEDKVFEIAERNKARSLLDLMGGGVVGRSSSSTRTALRHWRRLSAYRSSRCSLLEQELQSNDPDRTRISIIKKEITQVDKEIADAEGNMTHSGRPARSITAEVSSLNTVCASLPQDTLALQYIYDREQLFSWALSHHGMLKLYQKELPIYWLDREAARFHEACKEGLDWGTLGIELSRELLQPFHQLMYNYKRLIIVPHGSLHIIPFHALPFSNNEPLARSHIVTYLPSASVLRFLTPREKAPKAQSVLALGNPSNMSFQDAYGNQCPADPLPGTQTEVSHIAKIMPQGTVKAFTGHDATFINLREHIHKNYSILHLATHCCPVPEVPLLSSISLANGDECSVLDLLDLQLDIDLVILSACETGKGVATAGDDVFSFSRALLAAGARAVLVSLWPVDDNATCELFRYFYEGVNRGLLFADALHSAQELLRNSPGELDGRESRVVKRRDLAPVRQMGPLGYSLPAFWAPFILICG
ncbi:CHAT domain-containing protein [Aspergillus cavernicola]|uniref:CHAT domain-containing protein n=1 Tax=Aspergillus cavernicola TaxID=176166 RepID=A0ABR4J159_9EURO